MNESNEYWYFRMQRLAMVDRKIVEMKLFPVYGYQFVVIYLELCCYSVDSKGIIRIPYNAEGTAAYIAGMISEDPRVCALALEYFANMGLIKYLTDEDVYALFGNNEEKIFSGGRNIQMNLVVNNIGRSSDKADAKRIERNRTMLLEARKEMNEYGFIGKVFLTNDEYKQLKGMSKNTDKIIDRLSYMRKDSKNSEKESDYELIKTMMSKGEINGSD